MESLDHRSALCPFLEFHLMSIQSTRPDVDDLVFNVVYQVDQPQPGQFLAFILGYEL